MSTLNDFGFSNCIYYPTREEFSGNNFSSTLIDHVFFKSISFECLSAVLTFKIAEHYATSLIVYEINKISPPQRITLQVYFDSDARVQMNQKNEKKIPKCKNVAWFFDCLLV
jgi:hypothetical protein